MGGRIESDVIVLWNYTSFGFMSVCVSVQKDTQIQTDIQIHTHTKEADRRVELCLLDTHV